MGDSEPRHIKPEEAGTESPDVQSAWIGGGRTQPILSASRFGDANEGSRAKRHPLIWVAGWFAVIILIIAVLVIILR